jgi:UDP-glucose 4-epimerase
MDKTYLQNLIEEAKSRGGGLIVNQDNKPAAVVMTVEKYNELLVKAGVQQNGQVETQNEMEEDFHSNNNKKILVTGGAGYIGSHVVRELVKSGYEVIVIDNLSSGKREHVPSEVKFVEGDLADTNLLRDIFASENIYAVMHFAASLEVEESVREPQKYLQNNALNTANLLQVMAEFNVKKFIFSSTAAVYGNQEISPIQETAKVQPNNPYGYSKLLSERIIKYYCHFMDFHAVIFRYFNACGADFDGTIKPTHDSHLIPIVIEAAMGKRSFINVYGSDYSTADGTCVRDYVHVLDIARAHVLVLDKMDHVENYRIYNIGTGTGSSVLEIINQASQILNKPIPMESAPRRAGDSVVTVADNAKIKQDLGFELEYSDLRTIIKTTWHQMADRASNKL